MTAIIHAKNLSKRYKNSFAVKDASFEVQKGEVVGFVGLNGAGKSTTINMLLGFQKPTSGEVQLFGDRVTLPNSHKSHQRIGFATGDMALFDGMTGRQYLEFVARTYRVQLESPAFKELVEAFQPQLHKKLKTLSRGNKQKIALIGAFMTEPDLVILDEPSSGLDPLMQQRFLELVTAQASKGTTIFMSSHYVTEVVDVCTRILLIKEGSLLKDMPASELQLSSGKWVSVRTKTKVSPPKSAEKIRREKNSSGYTLEFIYTDNALRLQAWLSTLPQLQDVSITDHNPEAAFEDLYRIEEASDV